MTGRTLIAGIGNIFLGDDAFGVEVARRLACAPLPAGVQVADYGTSGLHLAYDLASGFERAILIDAAPRGGQPGTVTVLEVDPGQRRQLAAAGPVPRSQLLDGHGMQPDVVLGMLDLLGAESLFGNPGSLCPLARLRHDGERVPAPGWQGGGGADSGAIGDDGNAAGRDAGTREPGWGCQTGSWAGQVLVVGCEPASVDYGIGLSPPVAAAVDDAVRVVLDLVKQP